MRACYIKKFASEEDQEYELQGEKIHHLLNVVRIKSGEQILVLDGEGNFYYCLVLDTGKKKIRLLIEKKEQVPRQHSLSLVIGIAKTAQFEESIRSATELGFNQIIPVLTERSNLNSKLKFDRFDRIITSALEQSNNPFRPDIFPARNFENYLKDFVNASKICFSLRESSFDLELDRQESLSFKSHLLIGPEGGFTKNEEDLLEEAGTFFVKLKTPILRMNTALSCAVGYTLSMVG